MFSFCYAWIFFVLFPCLFFLLVSQLYYCAAYCSSQHTTTHLIAYRNKLRKSKDMEHVANDTDRLVKAACAMDSDIHCSPKQLVGATRRYLANYPTPYFQIIEDSRKIMKDMCNTYKPFIDDENHCGDE